MGVHVFPILNPASHLPLHPIPQSHPSGQALSTLSHASNLDWRSVSHMIIDMFQGYSFKSLTIKVNHFFKIYFKWDIMALQYCVKFPLHKHVNQL